MKPEAEGRHRPMRITGPRHFFAAAAYSLGGLRRLWHETAFRHECLGIAAVFVLFWLTGAGLFEAAVFAILALLLLAVEAINTAIEVLVDHLSPGWTEFARDAKDLGSFAVLCLLLANGIYVASVVLF